MTARHWELRRRPQGWPVADDVALVETDLPEPGPGQVLVENRFLSVDPYMRGRMNAARSYAAPYEIGAPMYGGAVGTVIAGDLPVGTAVQHELGWRSHSVVSAASAVQIGDATPAHLGVLGMPGLTAWVGLFDIGALRPGETVWVSAAAGAVGSLAGQLAKLAGCRVVGSAGGAQKCAYVVDTLGFDACIDHRAGDLEAQLREVLPGGLDVYFDNVGGSHLRAAIELANPFARLVECGMIEGYNGPADAVDNLMQIVGKKLTLRGFIVRDFWHRRPLFEQHVGQLLAEGAVHHDESVVAGIENQFEAFLDLLRGGVHTGKVVVQV